jgi:hypothetical protein
MKSIAFLNLVKDKIKTSKENRKQKEEDRQQKGNKHALQEFMRFCSLYLEYDHPFQSYHSHIENFTEKYIKTGKINPNQILDGEFKYTNHFNDTWDKHGITERFHETIKYNLKDANLLHLACILGNVNMVSTLLDLGADKTKLNVNGNAPQDFLFCNGNYMSENDFEKMKQKVSLPKQSIKLVRK